MNGKPVILVTRRLPDAVQARLLREYAPRLNPDDTPYTSDALVAAATGADALLVTPTERIDDTVIAALPVSVRAVATFSVGYEHIDVDAARRRGLFVTNTPGVLTEATADVALLLMLGAARRAAEGERLMREGTWTGWTPTQLLGLHLGGRRLGIIGMGRIGQALAHRARALGMEIHYHNRRRLDAGDEAGATFHATAEDLLAVADVLSLHCPASTQTRHFLNAERIELLPPGAIVVNTARGAVVDDAALMAALRSGRVWAAGLDVFEGEPAVHPDYRTLPNTFLLPHLGSATVETRNAMGFRALDNLDAIFAGQAPPHPVT
jgi:lactate dehydrogenase-like 2-hydroxyacid dehydrogenase